MAKKRVLSDEESLALREAQLRKAMGLEEGDKTELCMANQHEAVKGVISTGIPDLDRLMTPLYYAETGRGGIPLGFVIELFGPQGGGKSSLSMKVMGSLTRSGGLGLWIDAESCYVSQWADAQGIDNKRVAIMHNNGQGGEYFLEKIESVAETHAADLIVVDSITALEPKDVLETALDKEARMGKKAALMSRALPRLITAAKMGGVPIILINQVRDQIGVMFGNPENPTGGKALRFYASLRVRINSLSRKNSGIMKDGEMIGIRSNAQIIKSRFGPPMTEANVPFYFSKIRPHPLDAILDEALSKKIISSRKTDKLSGGDPVYSISYEKLRVEGFDEFKEKLRPEQVKSIVAKLVEQKWSMDADVDEYVKGLSLPKPVDEDEIQDMRFPVPPAIATVQAPVEGDPGA